MTEETKAVETVEPVATEESAGNTSSNGKKKYNHTPPEEVYDLSKPIPRVSLFFDFSQKQDYLNLTLWFEIGYRISFFG